MVVPKTAVALAAGVALSCAHVKPYYETAEICELRPNPTRVVPATLIDDAEGGRDQVAVHDGRNGYLYLYFDDATEIVRNPGDHGVGVHPVAGGANDAARLYGIRFEVSSAGHPFDVWIDDVAFVEKTPEKK